MPIRIRLNVVQAWLRGLVACFTTSLATLWSDSLSSRCSFQYSKLTSSIAAPAPAGDIGCRVSGLVSPLRIMRERFLSMLTERARELSTPNLPNPHMSAARETNCHILIVHQPDSEPSESGENHSRPAKNQHKP